jgi:anti-sigma factor RsiW
MHDRLPAYFDGELDAAESRVFEDHLAACPSCSRELESLRELRTALHDPSCRYEPPAGLATRVREALDGARPQPVDRRRPWTGVLVAAALAASFLLGIGLTLALGGRPVDDRLAAEVAAGHARSLLADHLFDVASDDRHTVKPWFQGRVDFSPPVIDLKDKGFPLAGGRLDYVDGRVAAALVYRHRQHLINLFVWPAAGDGDSEMKTSSLRGYQLAHWTATGLSFWAVSDLNAEELAEFARLVRGQSAG